MLERAYRRYNRPVVLTETSHPGEDRAPWLGMIAEEAARTLRAGVPLLGVCLYPIIDRPDWDHLTPWHRAGLWDADVTHPTPGLTRILHEPSAEALVRAQQLVTEVLPQPAELLLSTL